MKTMIYPLIILSVLVAGTSWIAESKECADCPKTPLSSPLDPNWQRFRPPPLAPGETADCHRVQFGKQDCLTCHKKDTPVAYEQWLGSKHGINNVKCGVCHGDATNYRAWPDKVICIGCHSNQAQQMPDRAPVTNCAYCHKAHWFTVHKIDKYKRFAPDREMTFKVPGF